MNFFSHFGTKALKFNNNPVLGGFSYVVNVFFVGF